MNEDAKGWDWRDVSDAVFGQNSDELSGDERFPFPEAYIIDSTNLPRKRSSGGLSSQWPEMTVKVSHRIRKAERQAWVWKDVCEGDWMRTTKQRGKVVMISAVSDAEVSKDDIIFYLVDAAPPTVADASDEIIMLSGNRRAKVLDAGLEITNLAGPFEHVSEGRTFYGFEAKAKLNVLCKNLVVCVGLKHLGMATCLGQSVCFRTHDNGRKRKRTDEKDGAGGVVVVGGDGEVKEQHRENGAKKRAQEEGVHEGGWYNQNNNNNSGPDSSSGGSSPYDPTQSPDPPPPELVGDASLNFLIPPPLPSPYHMRPQQQTTTTPENNNSHYRTTPQVMTSDNPHFHHIPRYDVGPPYAKQAKPFVTNNNPVTTTTTTTTSLPSVPTSGVACHFYNQRYHTPESNLQPSENPILYSHTLHPTPGIDKNNIKQPKEEMHSPVRENVVVGTPIVDRNPRHQPSGYFTQRLQRSLSAYGMDVSGDLRVDGVVQAHGFVQYSDLRLKTNISDITDALEMVAKLKGKSFMWKPGTEMADKDPRSRVLGFVAQEVKRVVPEVVSETEDGFLTVAYSELLPLLVEAFNQHLEQFYLAKKQQEKSFADFKNEIWSYVLANTVTNNTDPAKVVATISDIPNPPEVTLPVNKLSSSADTESCEESGESPVGSCCEENEAKPKRRLAQKKGCIPIILILLICCCCCGLLGLTALGGGLYGALHEHDNGQEDMSSLVSPLRPSAFPTSSPTETPYPLPSPSLLISSSPSPPMYSGSRVAASPSESPSPSLSLSPSSNSFTSSPYPSPSPSTSLVPSTSSSFQSSFSPPSFLSPSASSSPSSSSSTSSLSSSSYSPSPSQSESPSASPSPSESPSESPSSSSPSKSNHRTKTPRPSPP